MGQGVLVAPDKDTNKTASGLITSLDDKLPTQGKVLALGKDTGTVVVGDYVLYDKYKFVNVTIEGETLHLVPEKDVLAVFE